MSTHFWEDRKWKEVVVDLKAEYQVLKESKSWPLAAQPQRGCGMEMPASSTGECEARGLVEVSLTTKQGPRSPLSFLETRKLPLPLSRKLEDYSMRNWYETILNLERAILKTRELNKELYVLQYEILHSTSTIWL